MNPRTQLITIDNQQNVSHFQGCKLVIDTIGNCLLMEPENENVKVFVANFDKIFYRFKNILCILDTVTNVYSFMLNLRNEKSCIKTFDAIQKQKSIPYNNMPFDEMIDRLIYPIFNAIQINQTLKIELKPIMMHLMECFTEKDKQNCFEYLKERLMNDQIIDEYFGQFGCSNNGPRKKRNRNMQINNENIESDSSTQSKRRRIENAIDNGNNSSDRKLPLKIELKTESHIETDKQVSHIPPKTVVKPPNFEVITFQQRNITRKRLIIFVDEEKKKCYEYFWSVKDNTYRCCVCDYKRKAITAKVIQRRKKQIVKMGNAMHICDFRDYKPDKYIINETIIEAPNFELVKYEENGIPKTCLHIFAIDDRSKCYDYGWCKRIRKYECRGCIYKKKRVSAEVCQRDDGTTYVKLGPQVHICQYRKYDPNKFTAEKIVEASNFKICQFEENGISKQRLFIFTNAEKTKGYEYYWRNVGKYFTCGGCEGKDKHTAAKIEEKEDGTKFVRLLSPSHVCEMRDYIPDKYFFDLTKHIVQQQNFELFKFEKNGIQKSILVIFCPTNKDLCYEYFWEKHGKIYVCCGCANHLHVTAQICQNEDGEDYLKLNKNEHVCKLRPYNPEKFKTQNTIIQKQNYVKIDNVVNGISVKRLFIFAENDKNLCFEMYYDSKKKQYYCKKCFKQNRFIYANIDFDEEGQKHVTWSNSHVCEPILYCPKEIVRIPDYQLLKRKGRKKEAVQKLIIFASDDKKLCYEYLWEDTLFRCHPCSKLKARVTAKLVSNEKDGEFIELCRNIHKCKPIKYVPEGSLEVKTIKEPNFKVDQYMTNDGEEKKFLSVFIDNDIIKCYTYNWRNTSKLFQCYGCRRKDGSYPAVNARIRQDESNQSYVALNDREHICEPQNYQPKVNSFKIIQHSDFEIRNYTKNGSAKQDLIIFESADKKTYYSFGYLKKEKRFRCRGCEVKKRNIYAKLKKNAAGENYLEMKATIQHLCKPRRF